MPHQWSERRFELFTHAAPRSYELRGPDCVTLRSRRWRELHVPEYTGQQLVEVPQRAAIGSLCR